MIKTFKGLAADDSITKIRLSTNEGLVGYRILKLRVMAEDYTASNEVCVKLFTVEPEAATATFDFSDPTMVAAAYLDAPTAAHAYGTDDAIVVDNKIVNQDMFLTAKDSAGAAKSANWYLELEQVKLDLNEATVATLKDMRGRE